MPLSSVVSSSNFSQLMLPRFRKIFFNTYTEVPEQYPQVTNVQNSTKSKEEDFHVAGTGLWPEKESMGPIPYDSIDPSYEIEYEHVEYAQGMQVERKFVDDEKYHIIDKLPADLARKGRATVETTVANILTNGFTTACYDSQYLFDTDHPLEKSSGTGSNKLTDALGDAGLKNAITLMRKTPDQTGVRVQIIPTKLIMPVDLEFTGLTVLNSAQLSGSPNNDINVIKGRLKPIVLDYLTDTNAWYVQADNHEFNFFWRIRPEFKNEENFDTMIAKYRGYLRFCCGVSDWRGMVGSNPS